MARYTYTPGGRLATIESGNGIITRYTYDGEGNLSGLSVQKGEAWLLYAAAFTYDLRGNRLTKRGQRLGEGGRREKTHYHYAWIEEAGAVCPVIDFQETCCYNEGNQLTRRSSFGETTDYTYDANGSLVKETTVSPEGSGGKKEEKETFYHYDLLNRQVRVEGPEGRSTESHYDGEGLRAGLTTGKGESYTFLYHQGELMGEEGRKLLEAVPEGQRPGQPGNRGPEVPQLPSGRAGKHPLPDGWTGRGGKPLRLRCLWEPAWAGGGFSQPHPLCRPAI